MGITLYNMQMAQIKFPQFAFTWVSQITGNHLHFFLAWPYVYVMPFLSGLRCVRFQFDACNILF